MQVYCRLSLKTSILSCRTLCSMVTPYRKADIKYKQLFVNNRWVDSVNGKTFPTVNPATDQTICEVAEADAPDVDLAVKAAQEAFKRNSVWRKMDASVRGNLLVKAADLMEADISYISSIETMDTGKPFLAAVDDVKHAIEVYRYYGGLADKMGGKVLAPDGQYFSYTKAEPIGVCGLIIPWNYPAYLFAWKVGPAIASGNTCVVKPSELSPLSALVQASYFAEAGFPPGVLNVLPGYGPTAGAAVSSHPGIRKVGFTGSTETGKKVMVAAAGNLKKLTMELGGKSPIVIFPDADLDQAAVFCHGAIMGNCGQNCCAGSRNYVHADIYDEFVAKAKACAEDAMTGDPWDPVNSNGAMISKGQMERVLRYIEKGKEDGAKLECGGDRIGEKGCFVANTVFSDVTDDMTIAREEIFGPVQSILKFTDMEDVLDRCNATEYGLAAGVFTKDIDRAMYMAHNLHGGITWINCADSLTVQTPFGGFKQSGFGKELGEDAMKEYCVHKTVMMKVTSKNS